MRTRLCATLLAAGVSSPVFAQTTSDIPADAAEAPEKLWKPAMDALFGPYSDARICWVTKGDKHDYCLRPLHYQDADADGRLRVYLTAAGRQIEGEDSCYSCPAGIAFAVLEERDGVLAPIAKTPTVLTVNANGKVPDEDHVSLTRLGAPDSFGWAVRIINTEGPKERGFVELFGMEQGGIAALGRLPVKFHDGANCEPVGDVMGGQSCSSYSFDLLYEAGESTVAFAPVMLNGSGKLDGRPFEASYLAVFDPSAQRYVLPPEVPSK